jgi:hypothetical protein
MTLDVSDVPAFESERYMAPESETKARVSIFYTGSETVDDFWKTKAKNWKEAAEAFMDRKGDMKREASSLVQPGDTAEQKVRKIYDRVHSIRDLSYEDEVSEKEQEHLKLKDIYNVSDVLKNGYGHENSINRLFVALARAAGLDADILRVVDRRKGFFHKEVLSFSQFSDEVAEVKLNGVERFFSPATPFCPYGLLPWEYTDSVGLKWTNKEVSFILVSQVNPAASLTVRKAILQIEEDGQLRGELTVSLRGMEALRLRLQFRAKDDTERKKSLEDTLKEDLPSGATAELTKMGSWTESGPLDITFKLKIPEYAISTGKRLIVAGYPFQGSKGHAFQQSKRVHSVEFQNPWSELDDITVKLPDGCKVEKLPPPQTYNVPFAEYAEQVAPVQGGLRVQRKFVMHGTMVGNDMYSVLQDFYNHVKAGDDDQITLQTAAN